MTGVDGTFVLSGANRTVRISDLVQKVYLEIIPALVDVGADLERVHVSMTAGLNNIGAHDVTGVGGICSSTG